MKEELFLETVLDLHVYVCVCVFCYRYSEIKYKPYLVGIEFKH